jgi:hypothetical protein
MNNIFFHLFNSHITSYHSQNRLCSLRRPLENQGNLYFPPPKLYSSPLIEKIKIPRPLVSQATASNTQNIFSFSLLSPEGRAGEAWEPSNNMMFFLPLPLPSNYLTLPRVLAFPPLF